MNYLQLGNGGAFDYNQTNSSFMIDLDGKKNSLLLFDCGHSVFAEILRSEQEGLFDIDKLDYIYISHMDDDHMGSLKTLIYYMYFMKNKIVEIIAHRAIWKESGLEDYLADLNKRFKFGRFQEVQMFTKTKINLNCNIRISKTLEINATPTEHGKECFGALIKESYTGKIGSDYYKSIFISGDTKASYELAHYISNKKPHVIFHDFSNWNDVDSQVHACKEDFEKNYGKLPFYNRIQKYHNGEQFEKVWTKVN